MNSTFSRFLSSSVLLAGLVSVPAVPALEDSPPQRILALEPAWTNIQLPDCPVCLAHSPEPEPHTIVALQRGLVHGLPQDRQSPQTTVFLDLREKLKAEIHFEAGLHSVVFHPQFAQNRRVFLAYSRSEPRGVVLSEMQVPVDGPFRADPASEKVIMEVPHQLADHFSNNLAFGPDGLLYWSIGDGGLRDDPLGMAQHPFLLQGKILRLDVNRQEGQRPYAIPADNPFTGKQEWRGEIYALGFRNPWGMSFDAQTGRLWVADVGQEMFEEVNVVEKGANHGWAERDGPERQVTRKLMPENTSKFVEPVHTYSRADGDGICIVGGFVYRGSQIPGLVGYYLFGDWGVGKLWCIPEEGRSAAIPLHARQETEPRFNPTQICRDLDGEPLVLNHSGVIQKLRQIAPLPTQD